MIEYTSRAGNTIWYASREELERLPGYRGNRHKARACCPVHAGDNPSALSIDWDTGWAGCFACGDAFSIRVGEPPQAGALATDTPKGVLRRAGRRVSPAQTPQNAPGRTESPKTATDTAESNPAALERLAALSQAWAAAYAGSPAAEYVRARGIPDDTAAALGWGYVTDNQYLRAHRLFVPCTDPGGQLTGGAGRALDTTTTPKYLTLRNRDGYRKTLVNGGAIAQARAARMPLVVVEGPFDAAACLAGGMPYVVALSGATARPEWFAGIPRVFLANDADDAGRAAVSRYRRTVPVHATSFDPDALEGCKDVAGFWQTHGRLPAALITAASSQPDISPSDPEPAQAEPAAPAPAWLGPTLAELQARTAEAERYTRLSVDDLPADIRAEAETLGTDLAADPEEALRFMAELLQREHTLAAEDRCAAWHAIRCATVAWPEPDPLE
jgi:hypothetical protein